MEFHVRRSVSHGVTCALLLRQPRLSGNCSMLGPEVPLRAALVHQAPKEAEDSAWREAPLEFVGVRLSCGRLVLRVPRSCFLLGLARMMHAHSRNISHPPCTCDDDHDDHDTSD